MPAHIKQIIFHVLNKEANQTQIATFETNPEVDTETGGEGYQQLIDDLCKRYAGRAGKAYGYFEADTDNYPMQNIVSDYFVDKDQNFYDTSLRMISVLTEKARTETFATGGNVVISHYSETDSEYILVAIVNETNPSRKNGWRIEKTNVFDINNLKFAGRIDLTAWQSNAERYISFLKGSGDVSIYFKRFLGCDDTFIATTETKKLVQLLSRFVEEQRLEGADKEAFFEQADTFLKDLADQGNVFEPDIFANAVWPSEPEALQQVLADSEVQLSSGFIPDKRSLQKLTNFSGKTRYWNLGFHRKALSEGDIEYNPSNGTITIHNLPNDLIESLNKEVESDT